MKNLGSWINQKNKLFERKTDKDIISTNENTGYMKMKELRHVYSIYV